MSDPKAIHVFRAGTHTTMGGQALTFSEADLAASAAAYDKDLHQAPFVVGHPKTDAPAYAWAAAFSAEGEDLLAVPEQVDPAFAEMVNAGRFKKVSIAFYPPKHPGNPKPDVFYPRHIGLLGAQPPAVKGLRTPEFADGDEGLAVIEFGEESGWWFMSTVAGLFRSLRESLIESKGKEEADKVVPSWDVKSLEDAAKAANRAEPAPAYAEKTDDSPAPPGAEPDDKEPDVSEQEAAFAEREAELKKQEAGIAAKAKALEIAAAAARHQTHLSFCEALTDQGRLLPKDAEPLAAIMDALPEDAIAFGEGDAKEEKPPVSLLQEFLGRLPVQVEFGEAAGNDKGDPEGDGAVAFAAPGGYEVDGARADLDRKAQEYQAAHKCDYATAVSAVAR